MKKPKPKPGDCWNELQSSAIALTKSGQPGAIYKAVHRSLNKLIGAKLFTILRVLPDESVERVYTSHPKAYPLAGRKPKNVTPWYEQVIVKQRHYFGPEYKHVKAVFYDHELIRSLGCESVINVLAIHDGKIVGTVNLLHEARWFTRKDLKIAEAFAALLIPALTKAD